MSTMEKLFMQIFEKKNQVIEQVRHQTVLFDLQLAAKSLLDGIAPPPWLWSPSFPSAPSAPTESRKEELISGTLLPGSQPMALCSSSDLFPYNKPAFISENEELFVGNNTEVTADGQSDLLQLPVHDAGCDSHGAPELESGATSPQDQRNATVSDVNSEPFQSFARVQRSKTRQQALELRDSAKAAKSCLFVENDTNSLQPSSLRESSCMVDPTSVGRSSQGGKNVDRSKSSRELIEEDLSCLRSFGSVGVGSCPQQVGGQMMQYLLLQG